MDRKEKPMGQEDLVTKAIRARRRFKSLVRMVIANLAWLCDVEDEQLSRNVQRNVQLLTKRKETKGLLTLEQKGILCKPAEYRTPEEQLLLYKIIGGLKCFRKYPEHVKLQLAAVTYFVYYGPNRVIVRQNQEAHALYFIIMGEVDVSVISSDPVTKEEVCVSIGSMIAGSMFGEVSLLHDIPRTATITTTTACELLLLKKADFDVVLKASVKKQWDVIQNAMMKFTYFQGWDEVAVRECCIYSKIKPYVRDQTILGDGEGITTSAYFVLKGKCRLVEHLLTKTWYDSTGKKCYELYTTPDTYEPKDTIKDIVKKTLLDEKKTSVTSLHEQQSEVIRQMVPDDTRTRKKSAVSTIGLRAMRSLKSIEGVKNQQTETEPAPLKAVDSAIPQMKKKPVVEKVSEEKIEDETSLDLPKNVETHFMQVCIFTETACFGIGENLRRRRIVAMSDHVECLLIPRYWLMQYNTGNLWTRIKQYLDTQIPSTEKVFKEFVTQRKWLKYRNSLAKELFGKPPVTAIYNVPYSIRINEDIDFE